MCMYIYTYIYIYIYIYVYRVNHNDCMLRFTMRDKLPAATVIN